MNQGDLEKWKKVATASQGAGCGLLGLGCCGLPVFFCIVLLFLGLLFSLFNAVTGR